MQLSKGKVAVVTGAAGGIGFALADRWARAGLHVVVADVDEAALRSAAETFSTHGVETLAVPTDVSDESAVNALASTAVERFGAVHLVCNNAGVASKGDAWLGPIAAWQWVLGVNLMGVVHGLRAFFPLLAAQGEGHIVNTASVAGLLPGFGPPYDASKHAVVAITEDLYRMTKIAQLPVGVSVLCPGWVRTGIMDADRNWPSGLGEAPVAAPGSEIIERHYRRAVAEGMTPAAVADIVAEAVESDRFWIFTDPEFIELAVRRWHDIAEGRNPEIIIDAPGMPSGTQMVEELRAAIAALSG